MLVSVQCLFLSNIILYFDIYPFLFIYGRIQRKTLVIKKPLLETSMNTGFEAFKFQFTVTIYNSLKNFGKVNNLHENT